MAVLVGIDEAGYGPILGPLVVSAALFDLPDNLLGKSLWRILPKSICKNRSGAAGRLIINDSKKLHLGRGQYHLLQRGILAALKAADNNPSPSILGQLLAQLDASCSQELAPYPWYETTAENHPLRYDTDDINTAAAALAHELNENNARLLALWSRPVLAGRFNQMVQALDNKAAVLFTAVSELIYKAYQQFPRHNLQILIDKQGSRRHYRFPLQRLLPDLNMKILKEDDAISSYHLTAPDRSLKIHFITAGDDRQMPIALASMTSKYLRELFMELINQYFQTHCPGIPPTAGYYKDGRRFLLDLKNHNLPPHFAPPHFLIRQR